MDESEEQYYCDRLARNDPSITSVEVDAYHDSCGEIAAALGQGNTHIHTVCVDITDHYGARNQEEIVKQWRALCETAQSLVSLRSVNVHISKGRVTREDAGLVSLLLVHTRQIQDFEVVCTNGIIRDESVFSLVAQGITNHPALESFKLEGFRCEQQERSLAPLLSALSTVSNLSSLFLSPTCTMSNENEFVARPVLDAHYLEQILQKVSMRKLTLASCQLTSHHSRAIAKALSSPYTKLEHLEFWRCEISTIRTLLGSMDNNRSLERLILADNTLLDNDPQENADLLAPLAFNQHLKSLSISILDQGDWPRFRFLRENTKLKSLLFESRSSSATSLASLLEALKVNVSLRTLELSCRALYGKTDHHLSPLAFNRGLKRLELRNNSPWGRAGGEASQPVWPRFDFLSKNRTLEYLLIEAWRAGPPFEEGFASLCLALPANHSLRTLDLSKYPLQDQHVEALARMVGQNEGLRRMDLSGGYISGKMHLKFLPGLAQNTTLEVLVLTPYSRLATKVKSTCAQIEQFVRGVLRQGHLKVLEVGPCGARHLEPLIQDLAANYRMEQLIFHQSYGTTESKAATELQERINTITKLNRSGRRYLVQNGTGGPGCKAAGVAVLGSVNRDVDCLFYHLRENPSLCNRHACSSDAVAMIDHDATRRCPIKKRAASANFFSTSPEPAGKRRRTHLGYVSGIGRGHLLRLHTNR